MFHYKPVLNYIERRGGFYLNEYICLNEYYNPPEWKCALKWTVSFPLIIRPDSTLWRNLTFPQYLWLPLSSIWIWQYSPPHWFKSRVFPCLLLRLEDDKQKWIQNPFKGSSMTFFSALQNCVVSSLCLSSCVRGIPRKVEDILTEQKVHWLTLHCLVFCSMKVCYLE